MAEGWRKALERAARALFDEVIVGAGPVERQHPERVAQAWQQLGKNLNGPKLKSALGLPTEKSPRKTMKKSADAA